MKKSELKQLINEVVQEAMLPPKSTIDPDILELVGQVKEKLQVRLRKSGAYNPGLEDAILASLTHALIKGGWKKVPAGYTDHSDPRLHEAQPEGNGNRIANEFSRRLDKLTPEEKNDPGVVVSLIHDFIIELDRENHGHPRSKQQSEYVVYGLREALEEHGIDTGLVDDAFEIQIQAKQPFDWDDLEETKVETEGIMSMFSRDNWSKLTKLLKKDGFTSGYPDDEDVYTKAMELDSEGNEGLVTVDFLTRDMVVIRFTDETGVGPEGIDLVKDFNNQPPEVVEKTHKKIQDYVNRVYGASPNSRKFQIKKQFRQAAADELGIDEGFRVAKQLWKDIQ